MFHRRQWLGVVAGLLWVSVAGADEPKLAFEIYADAKGEHRWRLKEGETILATSGQGYGRKADCKTMVENLKKDVSKYTFEIYEDAKKEQRFRIKAKNGNIVGSSNGSFTTKAEAEAAVKVIEKGSPAAKITEKE
jgi:uncharacterized protein YegP (UPF0339 family)